MTQHLISHEPCTDGRDGVRTPGRRRFARSALLPLLAATAWSIGMPAFAAGAPIPAPVLNLDKAAMALFDAAEASDWASSGRALAQAKLAAAEVNRLENAFVTAGGAIGDFIEAQNNLSADLIEAAMALSVQDKRWLVSSADRIASRAGQLSQPFVVASHGSAPRIETLLFLDRRMRRALVWRDDGGFRDASDAFKKVWSSLRTDLGSHATDRIQALDQALTRLGSESSQANLKALDLAIRGLRAAAP